MSGSLLDRPTEIYRPFNEREGAVLRGFVANVRQLGSMRFFKEVPQTATQRFGTQGWTSEMKEPDDEFLRAAITQFRQIYNAQEPLSFDKALKVLKRSAHEHGGLDAGEAIDLLDSHFDAAKKAVNAGIGMGISFESQDGSSEDITPRIIIDAYFHGVYLHSGNKKSELAQRLDELEPWPRYTLYTVMGRLHNVYWTAANAAERPLQVAGLVDVVS